MSSTVTLKYYRNYGIIHKLVSSKTFWVVFLLLMFSYPIYRSVQRVLPAGPEPLFELPAYTLTNEFGQPFGSEDLKGRVYLANFIFTSCPSTCPEQTEVMKEIQKRVRGLGRSVALVSFTVDPWFDTPEVLYKYARRHQVNPHIWSFLTGDEEYLNELLIKGFKVPVGDREYIQSFDDDINLYDIAHSEQIVLVDGQGQVRGFYGTDRVSVDQLMIDVGLLVNRSELYGKN